MAAYIDDVIAPRLVSQSARAPSRPWPDLFQESLLVGRRGFALRAISAVDIALWDLFGKVAGQPVYRLLGGTRDTVEAYASGGYYRPGDPLERIDREIGRYLELGFMDVKIKVGGLGAARGCRARRTRARADRARWTCRTRREQCVEDPGRGHPLHPNGRGVRSRGGSRSR